MIGDKIKEILRQKGISQAELGRLIGKERSNVTNLLKSDNMGVQTLIQISKALNVPVSSFFEDQIKTDILNEPRFEYTKKHKEVNINDKIAELKNRIIELQQMVIELQKKHK